MPIVKVIDCKLTKSLNPFRRRGNQNTTIWFTKQRYGLDRNSKITDGWLRANIHRINNKITILPNTKFKILNDN